MHVRQGQTVQMTLTNDGAIPHSIDFHAARIAPNKAFIDVMPGKSFTFSFKANDPGVFMYHCGTKPVLMHIANGMFGAIVVDPATPLPKDSSTSSSRPASGIRSDGLTTPAQFDMGKAHARMADWMTFNGYAGQYVKHPLTADPGDLVRFWVVDAGPSIDTDFHIVGTVFDTAYPFGDMSPGPCVARSPDRPGAGRRRRRLRRQDRQARPVPVRLPRLRRGRPGPGRAPERRQRQGDDEPLRASPGRSRGRPVALRVLCCVGRWDGLSWPSKERGDESAPFDDDLLHFGRCACRIDRNVFWRADSGFDEHRVHEEVRGVHLRRRRGEPDARRRPCEDHPEADREGRLGACGRLDRRRRAR